MFCSGIFAQDPVIDSLNAALKTEKHDTTKIRLLSELSEICEISDISKYTEPCIQLCLKGEAATTDSKLKNFYMKLRAGAYNNGGFMAQIQGDNPKALDNYTRSLKLREEIKDSIGIATTLNNIGGIYEDQGDVGRGLEFYNKSLKIQKLIGDKTGAARSLNNMGSIYNNQGDVAKSLDHYHRSLKISEEINNKELIALSLSNISLIYLDQGDAAKALEYQLRSLKIREETKDKWSIAGSLNNIGGMYNTAGNEKLAIEYYIKSLNMRKEIGDKKGVALTLNNLASCYQDQKNIEKAMEYYKEGLKMYEEAQDKQGVTLILRNMSSCLVDAGKMNEALDYGSRSMKLAKELGFPANIRNAALLLKTIYTRQGKYKDAYQMYELEIQMRDSINNEQTRKLSLKKQFQYEYDKKAAADSVLNAEEEKVKNAQLTAQEAKLKSEKTKSYALYGGLAIVLLFAGFMVNRFRVTNKQKQIIEFQKLLVEGKHKEITDSINYAERIQRSFLATKELLDNELKNYFVLFQPKDVVSGDFYWARKLSNGDFLLATADSTGHGVPGAIMSILNISSLEKAVDEGLLEPAQILNSTRKTIIERLQKDGSPEGGKDGMDCSLICFNADQSSFTHAAANNPIWVIRKNESGVAELIEAKPDKMPVGKHDKDKESFAQHSFTLQKGDLVYTLTDGFADQFGGPHGKKFMYKQLKQLLIEISPDSMETQQQKLSTTLANWKKDMGQVDDITIIGIRV